MRTYDKLIATITTSQSSGDLRPCTGTSIAENAGNIISGIAAQQETG